MVNSILASVALIASMAFYFVLDDAMQSRVVVEVNADSMWHCDGWAGVRFKNKRDMRNYISNNTGE